jgi:hypothetical protein
VVAAVAGTTQHLVGLRGLVQRAFHREPGALGEGGHPRGPDRPGPALEDLEEYLNEEDPEWQPAPRWGVILALVLWTVGIAIWVFVAVYVGWI